LKHSGWEIEFVENLVTAAEVEEEVGVRIELPLLRVARMIGVVTKEAWKMTTVVILAKVACASKQRLACVGSDTCGCQRVALLWQERVTRGFEGLDVVGVRGVEGWDTWACSMRSTGVRALWKKFLRLILKLAASVAASVARKNLLVSNEWYRCYWIGRVEQTARAAPLGVLFLQPQQSSWCVVHEDDAGPNTEVRVLLHARGD
jgi:hypothetical protein